MDTTVVAAIAMIAGIALGLAVGVWYARTQRAWADYRGRKAEVPILRAAALAITRGGLKLALVAGVVVFLLFAHVASRE